MPEKYRVTQNCYVPVGSPNPVPQYKRAGQVVTLDKKTAAVLEGFVEPFDTPAPKKKGAAPASPNAASTATTATATSQSESDGSQPPTA